jgi:acyl-CoA oxidase
LPTQQVARALLEDRSAGSTPAQRMPLAGAAAITPQQLLALLGAYEAQLLGQIRGAMAAAGAAAGSRSSTGGDVKAAAAAAAAGAFDDNLDLVVELGWAHTERWCMQVRLFGVRVD